MRVIISYGARRRWRRRNAYIYNTQRTHTRLTYALIRTPTPACMHACMLSRPPPRTAMKHCVYATTRTPHPTIHITPTYTICCTTAHPRTLQHTQHPTHCNTTHATTYRSLRVPPRSRRDRRQETAQTHITPTAITTTMTMCDDM